MTYKERKQVRELIKGARKLRHANSDILDAKDNALLTTLITNLETAYRGGKDNEINKAVAQLEKQLEKSFPRKPDHWLRENIEVLLVAVVVAMAVRTYFLQPFKIPTGSMQPTLYGIHSPSAEFPPQPTSVAVNPITWLLWGRSSGPDGTSITGDHIFVDKVTYNFRKPKRGEVIVFQTRGIQGLDQDKFYIKRCGGLPGERLDIDPPFLFINGKKVEGGPFDRIYSMQDGYRGYTYPHGRGPFALPPGHTGFLLQPKCYFALGDNSPNSLDSRYWGCVPEANLVGRAFVTYWPFSKRWGSVR